MKSLKPIVRRIRDIQREKLPSGVWVYVGKVHLHGKQVLVASVDQQPGSWWSLAPEGK